MKLRSMTISLLAGAVVFASQADDVRRLYTRSQLWDWGTYSWHEYVAQEGGAIQTNSVKWVAGAMAVFKVFQNMGFSTVIDCYGIEMGCGSPYLGGNGSTGTLNLGAGGVTFTASGTLKGWMAEGQSIALSASQTWRANPNVDGVVDLGSTRGGLAYKSTPGFSAADDVMWTLTNITVCMNAKSDLTSCDVVVQKNAALYIGVGNAFTGSCLNARSLTVDGGSVRVDRKWAPEGRRNVARTLRLANGGTCSYLSPGVYDIDTLEISAGEVNLNYVIPMTQKVPLVVDAGATLTLSTAPSVGGFSSLSGSGTVNLNCAVGVLGDYSAFVGKLIVSTGIVKLPGMATWPAGFSVETSGSGKVYVTSVENFDASRIGGTGMYVNVPRERTTWTRHDGGGGYWNDGYWTDGTQTYKGWPDDEIATSAAGYNLTMSPESYVYKYYRNYGGFFGNTTVTSVFHIGAGGIEFSNGVGLDGWLGSAETIDLSASQSWTTAAGATSTSSASLGNSNFATHGTGKMTAADGITWTIAGKLNVHYNLQGDLAKADVTVVSPAQLNIANNTTFEGYLNCRKLLVSDGAAISSGVRTYLPADAYSIARDLEFGNGGTLTLSNASPLDMDTLSVKAGTVTVSGASALATSGSTAVSIAEDAMLILSSTFGNAATRAGALAFTGDGTLRIACTAAASTYVFDAASVSGFGGTIQVAKGAVIALSGAVDFPALEFLGDATVLLKLDRGDRIVDWSTVAFPASGTITLQCYRDDGIRPGEGTLDLNMDLSGVSDADRAKIAVTADGQFGSSPLKTKATPFFDAGQLKINLSATMSKENTLCGRLVWVGRDWADMTDPQNWVDYPNSTKAANWDPDNHPSDEADIKSKLSNSGIYSSSNWRLDLKGKTWSVADGRANNADGALAFAISNGTWNVNSFMVGGGRFDVENGATMNVSGGSTLYPAYFIMGGNAASRTDPFVFEVHANGALSVGRPTTCISTSLYDIRYQVDAGAFLTFQPWKIGFSKNAAETVFANAGELVFPRGLAITNNSTSVIGSLLIRQEGGTLRLAKAFELALGEGCDSTNAIEFAGGTTIISNDATFVNWSFRTAEGADFALEIPGDGEFATTDFEWATGTTLEKKGAGLLRVAVGNAVDAFALRLTEGTTIVSDTANAGSFSVAFAGGVLGLDSAETTYGILAKNGTVTGDAITLRNCAQKGVKLENVPFLTVPVSADPGYTTANVTFLRRNGLPQVGEIVKETILIDEVEYVRYRATFRRFGLLTIVR